MTNKLNTDQAFIQTKRLEKLQHIDSAQRSETDGPSQWRTSRYTLIYIRKLRTSYFVAMLFIILFSTAADILTNTDYKWLVLGKPLFATMQWQKQSPKPLYNGPSTDFPLSICVFYCTILVYFFWHISLLHFSHVAPFLVLLHVALTSCCTFFVLDSFRVALFPCCNFHIALFSSFTFLCCTLFVLHFSVLQFFHVALFLSSTFSELYSFRVALFSCSTFFHVALFSCRTFFRVALLSCCTFCALFSCCTFFHVVNFLSCTFFVLNRFHVAPFCVLHSFHVAPFLVLPHVAFCSCCTF